MYVKCLFSLVWVYFTIVIQCQSQVPSSKPLRADWMKGKYGMMVHWLSPRFGQPDLGRPVSPLPRKGEYVTDLNKAVDGFAIQKFMKDFDESGAEWLIFTIGQNRGTYASPNKTLDVLCGPGHTSKRDLVLELAQAVKARGKRFIAYLPCEIHGNETLHQCLGWTATPNTDQAIFQENYLKVIREWAVRFGKNLDGWWFDGCYPERESFKNQYMQWDKWYEASRAGNPDVVVTFNDGSFLVGFTKPVRPEHDYLSGEALVLIDGKIRMTSKPDGPLYMPAQAYVENTRCLNHALLPIDGYWAHGTVPYPDWANVPFKFELSKKQDKMAPPVYSDEELIKFVTDFTKVGGAVTLNVNIFQEGYLGQESLNQLKKVKKALHQ